jgi:DNA-binding response OmpR family regulator
MTTGTILVVDDEKLTLRIIKDALEDAGFKVFTAENGRQGLEILMANPGNFDALVVDRMMPEMDGMALLAEARQNAMTANIPVILQTAASDPKKLREGIEAGAFYYLTKPYDESTLVAIVRSAVRSCEQFRYFADYVAIPLESAEVLKRGQFRFSTLKEANSVAWLISQHTENIAAVSVGILALLTNAIEHGNLGIGGAEKEKLIRQNRWEYEVSRRIELPENAAKTVVVDFDATGEDVVVIIEDQGSGFDWHPYLGDELNLENRIQGRGILYSITMAFHSLVYEKAGSRVVAKFRRR